MKNKNKSIFSTRQKIYLPFKRFFDILASFLLILLSSIFLLVIGVIVWIDTKGFPVFRQRRIGKNNKEFLILKFRTMNVKTPRDVPTHLLENPDQFITKTGKFLRKSSLDELPQLFNIFVGQMSFIGPRPALWSQEDLISGRTKENINLIRPGLTGWAQVNGRDTISIEEKVSLDKHYLTHFNIWLDIKILFLTIARVVSKKDVLEGKQS